MSCEINIDALESDKKYLKYAHLKTVFRQHGTDMFFELH